MLNAVVIGVGVMGSQHARIYNELCNLVAVCDKNLERAKQIGRRYKCNIYQDYKEMLSNEKIDVVSIVVPTKYHYEVIMDVINYVSNILVEKPITSSIEEGKKVVDSISKKNIRLMIGHIERFNPAVKSVKEMIISNMLGNIISLHATRIGPFTPRVVDAGVLQILALHDIDVFSYILDKKISNVFCYAVEKIHSSYEDNVKILCKFAKSNVIASLDVNWTSAVKLRKLNIIGKVALVNLDYITQEIIYVKQELGKTIEEYPQNLIYHLAGEEKHIIINKEEPLKIELKHFLECIEKDKTVDVGAEVGLEMLKVVEACKKSYRTEKEIKLNVKK